MTIMTSSFFELISLLAVIQPMITVQQQASSFLLIQNGLMQQCDVDNACPTGYTCMTSHIAPNVRACYGSVTDPRARAGRCPLASEMSMQPAGGSCSSPCYFDQDCPQSQKCCFTSACGSRTCRPSTPINPAPQVTVLMDGTANPLGSPTSPTGFQWYGAVSLVQSAGKNILFDAGGTAQKIQVIRALRDKAGLEIADINGLIISHGHPDHNANMESFSDVPANYNAFVVTGSNFMFNALGGTGRYFFMNDSNLEVVKTPGHTLQDTSLLVYNVVGKGTVALVGDLIYNAADANQWQSGAQSGGNVATQTQSRQTIVCGGASWIVPGHGSMFQVTDATKQSMGVTCGQPTINQQPFGVNKLPVSTPVIGVIQPNPPFAPPQPLPTLPVQPQGNGAQQIYPWGRRR